MTTQLFHELKSMLPGLSESVISYYIDRSNNNRQKCLDQLSREGLISLSAASGFQPSMIGRDNDEWRRGDLRLNFDRRVPGSGRPISPAFSNSTGSSNSPATTPGTPPAAAQFAPHAPTFRQAPPSGSTASSRSISQISSGHHPAAAAPPPHSRVATLEQYLISHEPQPADSIPSFPCSVSDTSSHLATSAPAASGGRHSYEYLGLPGHPPLQPRQMPVSSQWHPAISGSSVNIHLTSPKLTMPTDGSVNLGYRSQSNTPSPSSRLAEQGNGLQQRNPFYQVGGPGPPPASSASQRTGGNSPSIEVRLLPPLSSSQRRAPPPPPVSQPLYVDTGGLAMDRPHQNFMSHVNLSVGSPQEILYAAHKQDNQARPPSDENFRQRSASHGSMVPNSERNSKITGVATIFREPKYKWTHDLLTSGIPDTVTITQVPMRPTPSPAGSQSSLASSSDLHQLQQQDSDGYTQALLLHQRARLEALNQAFEKKKTTLCLLRDEVGSGEEQLWRRDVTATEFPTVDDVRKLRDENRRLQIEIQCMTREIDMFESGDMPIHPVCSGDMENFHENLLETGSSSSGQSGLVQSMPPDVTAPAAETVVLPSEHEASAVAEVPEGEKWSCTACTLLNHPALDKCECCDMPRVLQTATGLASSSGGPLVPHTTPQATGMTSEC